MRRTEYFCDVCREPAVLHVEVRQWPRPIPTDCFDESYTAGATEPLAHQNWSPDLCQRHSDKLAWRNGGLVVLEPEAVA